MPDGVLPSLLILSVEREQVHDELVYLGERQHSRRVVLYSHRDEGDVGVWWLRVRIGASVGLVVARTLKG